MITLRKRKIISEKYSHKGIIYGTETTQTYQVFLMVLLLLKFLFSHIFYHLFV